MHPKFACAALTAALLSLCGSSQAGASTFAITSSGATVADGGILFDLSGNVSELFANNNSTVGAFQYEEEEQSSNFIDMIMANIADSDAKITTSNATSGPGFLGGTLNSVDITVSDPNLMYVIDDSDGSSVDKKGYDFTFTLYQQFDPNMQNPQYTTGSNATILGSSYQSGLATLTLATVPLPASAPMFGAALLALGAVGYGLKRKGKAAA